MHGHALSLPFEDTEKISVNLEHSGIQFQYEGQTSLQAHRTGEVDQYLYPIFLFNLNDQLRTMVFAL